MIEDEVILEVRAVREAFAASHGFNVRAMVTALRKMDEESGVPVVSFVEMIPDAQSPTDITHPASTSIGFSAPETVPII